MSKVPFTDERLLREYMFSGKAKITIKSLLTQTHFTYKIRKIPDSDLWAIHRLVRDDAYQYLGCIFPEGTFQSTKKTSATTKLTEAHIGFQWFWRRLKADRAIPDSVEVYHAGRCGMCGLELTDPVSITAGYGPICRKQRLQHEFMFDKQAL